MEPISPKNRSKEKNYEVGSNHRDEAALKKRNGFLHMIVPGQDTDTTEARTLPCVIRVEYSATISV